MECAERIRDYVASTHQVELPDEEIAYLGLHIHRLDDRSGQSPV
jgi:transcriptional antiterminator